MLKYWLWLTTRKGLGPVGAALVLRHFRTVEAAYEASPEEYRKIEGLRCPQALEDKDLSAAEKILSDCYAKRIGILTMQDAAYPERLRNIDDPPPVLYVVGTLPELSGPVMGVVGTRRASAYGLLQARRFGYGLSAGGCTVVSGCAKGIDTEAMKGALMGGAPVVGVVAGGLDIVYPAENRQLYRDVAHRGCLISEHPPGTAHQRGNFPRRNRIISGLSLGVLVVEAPEKSGAMITAQRAMEQGRDVFTVPANVGVESSGGNLSLLRSGAILARSGSDILQEYAAVYPQLQVSAGAEEPVFEQPQPLPEKAEKPPEEKKVVDKAENRHYIDLKEHWESMSEDERAVAELLRQGPGNMDDLSEGTKLSSARILSALTVMEVKGIVRRPSAKWYELAEAEE